MTATSPVREHPVSQGEQPASEGFEAILKYALYTGRKPIRYKGAVPEGEQKRDGDYAPTRVGIRNGRTAGETFSLDHQGFVLRNHATRVTNFYNDAEVRAVYYPEVTRFIEQETGASRVFIFDHTTRSTAPGTRDLDHVRGPARRIHNDYTESSGPQRVRDLFPPEEAELLLQRRFAVVNMWRPIRGPLEDAPLALCDARSVWFDDLIPSALVYPDRVGETYGVAYNPRHRWFYFPAMREHEALLIKCYDSDERRARFTPHGSFDDPAIANPLPRESIEVRTLVFFDHE